MCDNENKTYKDKILNVETCSTPTNKPQLQTICVNQENVEQWAIVDSGATSNFLMISSPTKNRRPATKPINVTLPNGESIKTSDECDLDIETFGALTNFSSKIMQRWMRSNLYKNWMQSTIQRQHSTYGIQMHQNRLVDGTIEPEQRRKYNQRKRHDRKLRKRAQYDQPGCECCRN